MTKRFIWPRINESIIQMNVDLSTQYGLSSALMLRDKYNSTKSRLLKDNSKVQTINFVELETLAFANLERINAKIGTGEVPPSPPPPP